ncbi:nuclear transport factor 2 family protein [Streptomyces sp. VNUA24]|uniref:YybH family protein n=1 Tax=Streptomyces sp. VNUA24 TaxID=3031131 RepID=UPI0023B7DE40|nr:nuclear transport factor 2 family protein [Streptomyces sp. VNUA24]WEH12980.1 nuclear transport factor 2 family protein [Streptomyces sp. VNUA24]
MSEATGSAATAAPSRDAENAAVEDVVRHHVLALNSADEDAIAEDWAPSGTLVDAFPPFVWDGDAPTRKWWKDLQAAIGSAGLTTVEFELGDWQRVFVAGDHAYAVAHATAHVSGPELAVEARGTWTFVLARSDARWKIVSWNWGGPPNTPVRR